MAPPRSQDFAVKMIASEGVIKSTSYYEKEQERERRQVRIVCHEGCNVLRKNLKRKIEERGK